MNKNTDWLTVARKHGYSMPDARFQNFVAELLESRPAAPVADKEVLRTEVQLRGHIHMLNDEIAGLKERAAPVVAEGWKGAAEWLKNNYQAHANIADLCEAMIAAHPVAGSPAEAANFCPRCGKRLHPGSVHTCTPPAEPMPASDAPGLKNMLSRYNEGRITQSAFIDYLNNRTAAPVPASEAAKQTLPQSECIAALRAAPASRDDANIAAGEWMLKHGYGNQPFIYALTDLQARIEAKDHEGLDLARKYFAAETELASRFRAEGGNTNGSDANLAAPAAPTDAKPDDEDMPKKLQAWRDGAGTAELGEDYRPMGDEFAQDVIALISAYKRRKQAAAQSVRDAAMEEAGYRYLRQQFSYGHISQGKNGYIYTGEPIPGDDMEFDDAIRALIQSPSVRDAAQPTAAPGKKA